MQIEITEKEALGIYSQRYLDGLSRKRKYLPVAISVLALVIGIGVMSFVHDWLGAGAFVVLASPSVFMVLREARASRKYFIDQMMEHHPEKILKHYQIEGQNPTLAEVKERIKEKERIFKEIR